MVVPRPLRTTVRRPDMDNIDDSEMNRKRGMYKM